MRNRGKIYFMLQSIILLLYLKKHQTFATKKKRQTSMGAKRVPCGPQHTSVPGSGTREQDGHDSHPSAAKPGSPEWESGPEAASPTWELARDTHLDPPRPPGSESLWHGPASCLQELQVAQMQLRFEKHCSDYTYTLQTIPAHLLSTSGQTPHCWRGQTDTLPSVPQGETRAAIHKVGTGDSL